MNKISYRSFFLGLGIGLIMTSSINLVLVNNSSEVKTKELNPYKSTISNAESEELLLMIQDDTNEQELYKSLSTLGVETSIDEIKKTIKSKKLKKGLYRINNKMDIEDILFKITESNK